MKRLLLFLVAYATAVEHNKIFMRSTELEDLEGASSGYVYDVSGPTSYVQFHSGNLEHSGHPLISLGKYSSDEEHAPIQYVVGHGYDHPETGYYKAENDGDDSHFIKEDGKKYDEASHSSKGEKSESGYKTVQEFDKGLKGSYSNEDDKGYYNEAGGKKDGNYDVGEHHDSHDEASKGAKGGSFSESKDHKKGSKTTGYHKVFHKDEYKKDRSFYDEANAKGYYDKFGNFQTHHSAEDGGYAKGGKLNSAYGGEKHGKKGHYGKGHYIDDSSGYKGKQGSDKYYTGQSEYSDKGGQESEKSFGYSQGDSEKYYR